MLGLDAASCKVCRSSGDISNCAARVAQCGNTPSTKFRAAGPTGAHRSTNQPALAPNVGQSVSTEPGRQCGAAGQAKGAGPRRLGPTRQTKARHEAGVHGKELRKRVVEILDGQRPARFEDAFEFGNGVAEFGV